MQKILNLLTFLGTSLLRGIDAFWAGAAFLTRLNHPAPSRVESDQLRIAKPTPLSQLAKDSGVRAHPPEGVTL